MTDTARAARLLSRIGQSLGIVALGFVAWRAWQLRAAIQWPPLGAGAIACIALSLAIQAASLMLGVAIWARILRRVGEHDRAFRALLGHWSWAHLARYVPGAVWQFVGMAAGATSADRKPAPYVAAFLVQAWFGLVSAILVASLTLALGDASLRWLVAGVPFALALALAHPYPIALAFALAARLGLPSVEWNDRWWSSVRLVIADCFVWLLSGVGFWLFAFAITGVAFDHIILLTGVYVAAFIAGAIIVFVPAGLGVREATLGTMLTPLLGAPAALALALASRLWAIAAELVTVATGALVARNAERR